MRTPILHIPTTFLAILVLIGCSEDTSGPDDGTNRIPSAWSTGMGGAGSDAGWGITSDDLGNV
jgi:hypothetical protein